MKNNTKLSKKYQRYIRSAIWKQKRKEALEQAEYKCYWCKSTTNLQVHHLTYKRLGHELLEDLLVLCKECHEEKHGKVYRPDGKPVSLSKKRKKKAKKKEKDVHFILARWDTRKLKRGERRVPLEEYYKQNGQSIPIIPPDIDTIC